MESQKSENCKDYEEILCQHGYELEKIPENNSTKDVEFSGTTLGIVQNTNLTYGMDKLQAITGFTADKCANIINQTGWSTDETSENIKNLISANAAAFEKEAITEALKKIHVYDELCDNLTKLNTMRGGKKGFKGFVAENMQATEATVNGRLTKVINNNSSIDMVYIGRNGHRYYQQMKIGYKPGIVDFSKYKGQTIIVDKGNPYFKVMRADASKQGVKLVEGNVTNEEAKRLADAMQIETKITGNKNSYVVPTAQKGVSVLSVTHEAGLKAGKTGALAGAGFSIGSNLVDVACGDVRVSVAAKNVAKDTAVSYGVGYALGAGASLAGSTTAGTAVIGMASTAGSAIAGTTVGGAVVGAGTAATVAIGGAGVAATSAVIGAAGTVGSAVGSAVIAATAGTAVGGAVASGVAATAVVSAAVGAAAVAAAPVVAVGAVLGVGYKLWKKIS